MHAPTLQLDCEVSGTAVLASSADYVDSETPVQAQKGSKKSTGDGGSSGGKSAAKDKMPNIPKTEPSCPEKGAAENLAKAVKATGAGSAKPFQTLKAASQYHELGQSITGSSLSETSAIFIDCSKGMHTS